MAADPVPARPPFRERLLVRLIAGFALVAVTSIGATAWLAAQNTSGAIRNRQGEVIAGDTHINDALIGYAAQHPAWNGVGPAVRELARTTGRRVALTTEQHVRIADSEPGTPLPGRASAVVDPLAVDVALARSPGGDRIDPRAVGPFALPTAERARLRTVATRTAACLSTTRKSRVRVETGPSGRPYLVDGGPSASPTQSREQLVPLDPVRTPVPSVRTRTPANPVRTPVPSGPVRTRTPANPVRTPVPSASPSPARTCPTSAWTAPTATERAALARLQALMTPCLKRYGQTRARVRLSGPWTNLTDSAGLRVTGAQNASAAADCLASARRRQLDPYTAPAALLYIGEPSDPGGLDLSGAGIVRLALITSAIVVLTVGLSVLLATRLVRPVRALTDAAQRMRGGDPAARVDVRAGGEVGRLAAAFNAMAAHLERMEHQRKEMVSDVSHELRTPLSNVRGWLEAAEDGVAELDPKLTASLVEETLTLQRIVDDLQELALADAGKLRLHAAHVDLADVLDRLATAHGGRAETAGVRLTVSVGAGGLETVADPVRLRQALGNLVANAIRYTPAGGAVTLRAYRDGGEIVIEVADTGVGIGADELPYVFDRFWRAEKSRSRDTGGSGLGLPIARSLVEAHGGTLTVTSTPGRGSTFTVRLQVQALPAAP